MRRCCIFCLLALHAAAIHPALAKTPGPDESMGRHLVPTYSLPYHLELPNPQAVEPAPVSVGIPIRRSPFSDPNEAAQLLRAGRSLIASENPKAYLQAIETAFRPAIAKDPKSLEARSLLALAYLRTFDFLPHDEETFKTLEALLYPAPPRPLWTSDYVAARSEFYQLLLRFDLAEEILSNSPVSTPELFFQKAKLALAKKDGANAKKIAAQLDFTNPRHFAFAVKMGVKNYSDYHSSPEGYAGTGYAPGLLQFAESTASRGAAARPAFTIALRRLLSSPEMLDPISREHAYLLAGEALLEAGELSQALNFARAGKSPAFLELKLKALALHPESTSIYSEILEGYQEEQSGNYTNAILSYVRGLEKNRRDSIPFLLLGGVYEKRGEVFEAIDRYQKALFDTDDKPGEAAARLVRIFTSRFERVKANAMLNELERKAVNAHEGLDQVSLLKAIFFLQERRPDLAEAMLHDLLARGSHEAPPHTEMGDLQREKKNDKLAEFFYAIALRYDPLQPKALLGLALARFNLESPSHAISLLEKKLEENPLSPAILTALAITYLRSGDQGKGKTFLQNAIRADRHYSEAFRLLGDLTREQGDREKDYAAKRHNYRYALASYEMYSKLNPNDPEGYMATANLYFDLRDLGAAAQNYLKVLELTPNHPDVRVRLAQISRNGGDASKALELLQEEIKTIPRADSAHVETGNIRMAQKDFDLAKKEFIEAVRINEKNSAALFGLGVIYHLTGSYDEAHAMFKRVMKLDPLKADVYWQTGLIYQKQRNFVKALQSFSNYKSITREPAALAKADEKIREMGGTATSPAYFPPQDRTAFEILGPPSYEEEAVGICLTMEGQQRKCPAAENPLATLNISLPSKWKCRAEAAGKWSCHTADEMHAYAFVEILGRQREMRVPTEAAPGTFGNLIGQRPETLSDFRHILSESHPIAESYSRYESSPRYSRNLKLGGRSWVDALHLNSFRPGFYTRYLATVEGDATVLVAIHLKKERYQEAFAETDELVKGLRLQRIDNKAGKKAAER